MSGCRVTICIAQVPPKENPPAAHCEGSGSTSSVRLIQAGTSAARNVSARAILLSMQRVLPEAEPLGSTTTTTGATPWCSAAYRSMRLRSAPPVSQSAGAPGWPAKRTRTGRAGRGRGEVGRRQIDVGLAAFEARAGAGDDGAPQHAAVGQIRRRAPAGQADAGSGPGGALQPVFQRLDPRHGGARQVAHRVVEAKVAVDLDGGEQDDAEQGARRRRGPRARGAGCRPARGSGRSRAARSATGA